MRTRAFYRGMFAVAALYDLILGLFFFLFYRVTFEYLGLTEPVYSSLMHLSAAFVFVQGISYLFVYWNMERNIDIVKVGFIYKLAYTGVAFFYWGIGDLPHLMFAAFGISDLVFVFFFYLFLRDHESVILKPA